MKAFLRNVKACFNTNYVQSNSSIGSLWEYIEGLEYDLLKVVLQQMNMELLHDLTPDVSEMSLETTVKLIRAIFAKEVYIALGGLGTDVLSVSYFDSTNPYFMTSARWYVQCSVKYRRSSSIFKKPSVELWLVLIVSIFISAVSATLFGRYSCTSEWQRYKSLSSALTSVWAVILEISVSTMPLTPSLRSLFVG